MSRPPSKVHSAKSGPTPAMRQFFKAKADCPDAILFFQMGDFYELFFEDAELAGPLLDLALTSRQKIDDKPVPMCGVPLSAADGYISRLVSMGHKVAVCDQVAAPAPGALAERVVKRIVTPGTLVESEGQIPSLPRFLAAFGQAQGALALAAADLSTGSVLCGRFDEPESLLSALAAIEPREVLISERAAPQIKALAAATEAHVTERGPEIFQPGEGLRLLKEVYGFAPQGGQALASPASDYQAGGQSSSSDFQAGSQSASSDHLAKRQSSPQAEHSLFASKPSEGPLERALFGQDGAESPDSEDFSGGGLKKPAQRSSHQSSRQSSQPSAPPPSPSEDGDLKSGEDGESVLLLVSERPGLLSVMGALLGYLKETAKGSGLGHLSKPRLLAERGALGLDEAAVRNLELFKTLSGEANKATLLAQIDMAVTPMGARTLRDWLARPLVDRRKIEGRHEAVGALVEDLLTRRDLTDLLGEAGDMERALGRIALGRGTLRDLHSLRRALGVAPKIKSLLSASPAPRLFELGRSMDPLAPLFGRLEAVLADKGLAGKDGPFVSPGVSPALDELRSLESGGKMEIAAMEQQERRRTGISNLKIGFNRIFGYYLEVTKSNLASVPPEWIRKQTITGGERYVTESLKSWEEKVLTAGDKRQALEARIIENLKAVAARHAPRLKALAQAMSEVDALASLAACAEANGWTRPAISADDLIDIKGGRHPVVERFLPPGEAFVENDVLMNSRERILIITGPNMAGKSTILRQTALIVILCQMGSFVPAASARLSIRDQVFTRVGASDDLAKGRSTFMVEMSETARILKKATPSSLVILDEVGRGTSTFDGLAIAWAVAERLHDLGGRGAPTLFATHYHELVELSRHKSMVRNYNVSVKRWGDKILFLRKLAPGGVNRSYGLDVASLAGLPPQVVKRAREVLADISRQGSGLIRPSQGRANLLTLAGLGQDGPQALAREIASLETDTLTPLEAMTLLVELKRRAGEVLS